MNVTQQQIIRRGLANRCPNCGSRALFQVEKPLSLNRECPQCGLKLEREEGFFLGAMALNYGATCLGYLLPMVLLWYCHVVSDQVAIIAALVGAVVVPLLLYRSSRSWQLMLYYFFFPQHLPANRRDLSGAEDENV